jgi:single-stranded DNA-specific DHH superfamily exonuclease
VSDFSHALKKAARVVSAAQPLQVITHGDVDGIAAGALAHSALDCTVAIQSRLSLNDISSSRFTLFLDLGSSQIQDIRNQLDTFFIIDHHPCTEYDPEIMINPWMYGIDGTRKLSAAALFYLVIKHIDEKFTTLSYLGLVGALGDRQPLTEENKELLTDARNAGILQDSTLFNRYDLHEFVDMVNACSRNGKKELALRVCLLKDMDRGKKELETYTDIFQKNVNYLEKKWPAITEENRGRSALFIYDTHITQKYAGELATDLARRHQAIVILMAPDADGQGIKISGRATPDIIRKGVHLGEAFSGYGGGHDIAAGAFLRDSSQIETFIQVVTERIHHMVAPITVTLDIPVPDAETVMKALAIDNEGYKDIQIRAEGTHIVGEVTGAPGTVKNTVDDIIACIISAMHMMEEE